MVARWPPEHFGAGAGTGKTVVLIHRAPRRVPPRRRQRVSPNVAPLAPYECGLAIPLIRQIIAGGQRSASNPVHKVGWEPCGCTAGPTRHLLVPALRARVGGPAVRADRGRHLAGAGFGPAELGSTDPRSGDRRGWWRPVAPLGVLRRGGQSTVQRLVARAPGRAQPRPSPGIGRHAHQTGITRTVTRPRRST